jgi:hypothetical protein
MELINVIVGFICADTDALRACACVHSSWTPTVRTHLYRNIRLSSLHTWMSLGKALKDTPELIPLVKHVTIDGGVVGPGRLAQTGWSRWILPLAGLLTHVESLTVHALDFRAAPDPTHDLIRTHFLGVKHLRVDSVTTPDTKTLQEVLLAPRPALEVVALHRIYGFYLAELERHDLALLSYPQLELDGLTWSILGDIVQIASASQSHVRVLTLHGLRPKHFPNLVATLRAIGPSLESLEVRVRGTPHRRYPEGKAQQPDPCMRCSRYTTIVVRDMLENNRHLRDLTWVDSGSTFVNFPQDFAQIFANAGSWRLQQTAIYVDPEGSDMALDEVSCAQGWAPLAQAKSESAFPSLESLTIHWIRRGSNDFSKMLAGLFGSHLRARVEAASMNGPSQSLFDV